MILAIDPSIRAPGVAVFCKEGTLRYAAAVRVHAGLSCDALRCQRAGLAIVAKLGDLIYGIDVLAEDMGIDVVVFEWPQKYQGHKSKVPVKDIFPLVGVGMYAAGALQARAKSYLPAEWAGQLPKWTRPPKGKKTWQSPRALRIESRLDRPYEREIWLAVRDSHDSQDAIGIGLHHFDRLGRRRVLAGTTTTK